MNHPLEGATPHTTEVKVSGQPGVYWFRAWNESDRSVTVWGGDRNPNGRRSFRTFPADRCREYRRRVPLRERV